MRTTTAANPAATAAAPEREWQVGDRVRIIEAVRSVGELATVSDTEPPVGCFVIPDSGMFSLYVSHSGLELVEAAPAAPEPPAAADAEPIAAEIVTPDHIAQRLTRLSEVELDITEGLAWVEQGKALIWAAVHAVRSEELWQVAGYPSFEAYCEQRWGWKKANAHENALAGEVLSGLLVSGVPVDALPTSTSAMSQLAKAPAGDRPAVLQKAADLNGGRVTEAAVRAALKPEPSPEDELAAAGIPVYSPDTSDAAIAEGLAHGDIVPTTEQPTSAAPAPRAAASPTESAQVSAKAPAPVLAPSDGGYAPGTWCRVEGHVGHHLVVAPATHLGGSVTVWSSSGGSKLVGAKDVEPFPGDPDPDGARMVARVWLREMASVLGAEAVAEILGEVTK